MVNGNANAGFQLDLPGKHRNFNVQMKNWLLSLLLVFAGAQAFSQQDYFIYLQADNHQPFYMRLNDKVYSSTEAGCPIRAIILSSVSPPIFSRNNISIFPSTIKMRATCLKILVIRAGACSTFNRLLSS
jgi:hypothetical protein